jgi:hypothetical protein
VRQCVRVDHHSGNVVEDIAVVVGSWVRDIDNIEGGESLLRFSLRALDRGGDSRTSTVSLISFRWLRVISISEALEGSTVGFAI